MKTRRLLCQSVIFPFTLHASRFTPSVATAGACQYIDFRGILTKPGLLRALPIDHCRANLGSGRFERLESDFHESQVGDRLA